MKTSVPHRAWLMDRVRTTSVLDVPSSPTWQSGGSV